MVTRKVHALPASMILLLVEHARPIMRTLTDGADRVDRTVYMRFPSESAPIYKMLGDLADETVDRVNGGPEPRLGWDDRHILEVILRGVVFATYGRRTPGIAITLSDYESVTERWRSVVGMLNEDDAPTTVVTPTSIMLF